MKLTRKRDVGHGINLRRNRMMENGKSLKKMAIIGMVLCLLILASCQKPKEIVKGLSDVVKNLNDSLYSLESGSKDIEFTLERKDFEDMMFSTGLVNGAPYVFSKGLLGYRLIGEEEYDYTFADCMEWNLVTNSEGAYAIKYDGSETKKVITFGEEVTNRNVLNNVLYFGNEEDVYKYNLWDNEVSEGTEYDVSRFEDGFKYERSDEIETIQGLFGKNIQLIDSDTYLEYDTSYLFEDGSYFSSDFLSMYLLETLEQSYEDDYYDDPMFISDDRITNGVFSFYNKPIDAYKNGYTYKEGNTPISEIIGQDNLYYINQHKVSLDWSELNKGKEEVDSQGITLEFNEDYIAYQKLEDQKIYIRNRMTKEEKKIDVEKVRDYKLIGSKVLIATIGEDAGLFLYDGEKLEKIVDEEVREFTIFENQGYAVNMDKDLYKISLDSYETSLAFDQVAERYFLDEDHVLIVGREKDEYFYDGLRAVYTIRNGEKVFLRFLAMYGEFSWYNEYFVHDNRYIYGKKIVDLSLEEGDYNYYSLGLEETVLDGTLYYENDEIGIYTPWLTGHHKDLPIIQYNKADNSYRYIVDNAETMFALEEGEYTNVYTYNNGLYKYSIHKQRGTVVLDENLVELTKQLENENNTLYETALGNLKYSKGLLISDFEDRENSKYFAAEELGMMKQDETELVFDVDGRDYSLTIESIYNGYLSDLSRIDGIAKLDQEYSLNRYKGSKWKLSDVEESYTDPMMLRYSFVDGNGHDSPEMYTEINLLVESIEGEYFVSAVYVDRY